MLDNKRRGAINNSQEGSILVLTLLIMSIMAVIALTLSVVIINQLKFSQNIDNAMNAYYGAESGIELGLYETRKLDLTQDYSTGMFDNGVEWERRVELLRDEITFNRILENKSIQLDLFDPDNPECNSVGDNAIECINESMIVTWDGQVNLEISYTEWPIGPIVNWSPTEQTEKRFIATTSPYVLNTLKTDHNYRVKVKPLFDDVENLSITLYNQDDGLGDIVPIPNFLVINGVGSFRNSKQGIRVDVPRKIPLSPLFDYVIFSEDDVIKE